MKKHKLVIIFPFYPSLQAIYTYDLILGLQCLGYDVYFVVVQKTHFREHMYFKDKCKIYYLDDIVKQLSFIDYIIYGIRYLVGSFYISFLFFLYLIKNTLPFRKIVALLKFKYVYNLNSSVIIFTQTSTKSLLYGVFLKNTILNSKLIFEMLSYYPEILGSITIERLNIRYKPYPIVWFLVRYCLKNIDMISTIAPELYLSLVKSYKKFHIKTPFLFTQHKIPISFCYAGKKDNNNKVLKVAFVSVFQKVKAVKEAIIQITDLLLQNDNIEVFLIGDGIEKEEIEKHIKTHKLVSKIKLLGIKDRLEAVKYINDYNVLIHNSYLEGGPAVLLEALMCKTVPVIRGTGIVKYYIKNGFNGYIIDDSENTLTTILTHILKNPDELLRIQSNISNTYKMNMQFNSVIEKFMLTLEYLCKFRPYTSLAKKQYFVLQRYQNVR